MKKTERGGAERLFRCGVVVCWLVLVGGVRQSQAWDLTSNNSVVSVEDTGPLGVDSWTIDGLTELYQQSFWYRIGSSGGQTPIYTLNLENLTQNSPDQLMTEHSNGQFDFTVNYLLTGGAPGSGTATLSESATVQNLLATPLDFHLYQLVDFDLGGSYMGDTLQLGSSGGLFTSATQTKASSVAVEVLGQGADHGQAGLANQVWLELLSGQPVTLNDDAGPVGPGDAAFGFEWDFSLAPNDSLTVTLQKGVSMVPEPSSLALAAIALAFCVWQRRP